MVTVIRYSYCRSWSDAVSGRKFIIVGISGGVDSSVAALLLQQQGHRVEGLFMKNWEEDDSAEYCSAAADLAGKKVAVTKGSSANALLVRALRAGGQKRRTKRNPPKRATKEEEIRSQSRSLIAIYQRNYVTPGARELRCASLSLHRARHPGLAGVKCGSQSITRTPALKAHGTCILARCSNHVLRRTTNSRACEAPRPEKDYFR